MKGITAPLHVSDLGDLNKPPHVLSQLIDMITGELQLPPAQQEQRWEHLAECIHCQAFLGSYLIKMIEYNKAHGEPEEPAQELLSRLARIMHETLKEDIPAYVETLEELGEGHAKSRFPEFANHLQTCRDCQLAVQDLRSWLVRPGETELL